MRCDMLIPNIVTITNGSWYTLEDLLEWPMDELESTIIAESLIDFIILEIIEKSLMLNTLFAN